MLLLPPDDEVEEELDVWLADAVSAAAFCLGLALARPAGLALAFATAGCEQEDDAICKAF